jgi:ABC-type phosphate/phosphonate transport system permease subunit
MKSIHYRRVLLIILAFLAAIWILNVPQFAYADEHEDAGKLEHTVSTADKTGLSLFLADLYNDHRLLYALVVTATMAFLGMIVALVTDFILKLIGLRKSRKTL